MATESTLKLMKNAFYFTLKALFVLKIFRFFLDFLVMYRNGLIKMIKLISNFFTAWLTNYRNTHIANISRSKGNQTMKFGLLIQCNMRNIFLEKSYTKFCGETSLRPFSEKLILSISLDQ